MQNDGCVHPVVPENPKLGSEDTAINLQENIPFHPKPSVLTERRDISDNEPVEVHSVCEACPIMTELQEGWVRLFGRNSLLPQVEWGDHRELHRK